MGTSWRAALSRAVDETLIAAGMAAAWERRTRRSVRVLAFHGIDDPANFARLAEIIAHEWHPVSLDAVVSWLSGGAIPQRSVLVTFDDGDPSLVEHAVPVLTRLRVPAVAFVISELIGSQRLPWWELVQALEPEQSQAIVRRLKSLADGDRRRYLEGLEQSKGRPAGKKQLDGDDLRALEAAGIEIGNHTMTHPILPMCDDCVVRDEVVDAHQTLSQVTARAPRTFAYPNGGLDPRAELVLADLGYEAAFLFDHRLVRPKFSALQTSRLRVDSTTTEDRFRLIVSGVHPALMRLRQRLGVT